MIYEWYRGVLECLIDIIIGLLQWIVDLFEYIYKKKIITKKICKFFYIYFYKKKIRYTIIKEKSNTN